MNKKKILLGLVVTGLVSMCVGLVVFYLFVVYPGMRKMIDESITFRRVIEIQNAVVFFEMDKGKEITDLHELIPLYYQAADENAPFEDAWGNQIEFTRDEDGYKYLSCLGPDGVTETGDDISLIFR